MSQGHLHFHRCRGVVGTTSADRDGRQVFEQPRPTYSKASCVYDRRVRLPTMGTDLRTCRAHCRKIPFRSFKKWSSSDGSCEEFGEPGGAQSQKRSQREDPKRGHKFGPIVVLVSRNGPKTGPENDPQFGTAGARQLQAERRKPVSVGAPDAAFCSTGSAAFSRRFSTKISPIGATT